MTGLCECGCGQPTKLAPTSRTKIGQVRGQPVRFLRGHSSKRHGDAVHGQRRAAEYRAWRNMLGRCYEPKRPDWPYYGGRGIQVCDEWRSYEKFLADIGRRPSPQHSLDRINNDGNYEPGNVRWTVHSEQMRNRRPWKKRLRRAV